MGWAVEKQTGEPDFSGWSSIRLSGLLQAAAGRDGARSILRDSPERRVWSGRPQLEWTYAGACSLVARLALFFSHLGLKPGSLVGICLPNGTEACAALLAVEQAGHVPCLLPLAWSEAELGAAIEAAGIQAIVTQGMVGEQRPAELFCRLASRYFGLRFLCAFGPFVPDGVIDLDRVVELAAAVEDSVDGDRGPTPGTPGLVTFPAGSDLPRPVYRPTRSLVAAAVGLLRAVRIERGERILTLISGDTLAGVATGLTAALLTGATLECHGLFDGKALTRALEDGTATHLVAPGWLEPALAEAGCSERAASTILVHRAPVRFKANNDIRARAIDVLALGEIALLARPRGPDGCPALTLDLRDDEPLPLRELLRAQRRVDGAILLAGPAAEVWDYSRAGMQDVSEPPEWRDSGFKADVFAGRVIGVTR